MLRKITLFVIGLHLSLVFALTLSPSPREIRPKQRLVVRTEKLQPLIHKQVKAQTSTSSPSPPAKKPQPKPVKPGPPPNSSKSTKKKEENHAEKRGPPKKKSKEPTQKAPAKKTKEPAKKPEKKQSLFSDKEIQQMEEALAVIEGKQKTPEPPLQPIGRPFTENNSKEVPTTPAQELANSYEEALVSHLHAMLHLPEYGDVSIELTLLFDGSVTKVVVLKAESVKNRKYLETHLPLLRFPPLLDSTEKEKTFKLIFSNEL